MNKELKPCPFCGGEAKVSDVFGRAGAICKDCLAEMRGYLGMTEEEVIEAWNTRKPIDDIVGQLEKLKEWGYAELMPCEVDELIDKAIEIVKGGIGYYE